MNTFAKNQLFVIVTRYLYKLLIAGNKPAHFLQLSDYTGIDRNTIAKACKALEKEGYVTIRYTHGKKIVTLKGGGVNGY